MNLKNSLLVIFMLAVGSSVFAADLLVAWDSAAGTNYSFQATGISGALYSAKTAGAKTDGGSTDGTYGSLYSGASTVANWALAVGTNSALPNTYIGIKIQNDSANDLVLDKLLFDASRSFALAPQDLTVVYSFGNLSVTTGTVVTVITGVPVNSKTGDYGDYDVSLTGLSDYTLAPGESAIFQIIASNGGSGSLTYVDNFAFTVLTPVVRSIKLIGITTN